MWPKIDCPMLLKNTTTRRHQISECWPHPSSEWVERRVLVLSLSHLFWGDPEEVSGHYWLAIALLAQCCLCGFHTTKACCKPQFLCWIFRWTCLKYKYYLPQKMTINSESQVPYILIVVVFYRTIESLRMTWCHWTDTLLGKGKPVELVLVWNPRHHLIT